MSGGIIVVLAVVAILFLLIILVRSGAKDLDEEAVQEAHDASVAELNRVLHPPPKTMEEIEEENEMYEDK